jgi:DNA repair exonuclease SbcCD ATPase subunit
VGDLQEREAAVKAKERKLQEREAAVAAKEREIQAKLGAKPPPPPVIVQTYTVSQEEKNYLQKQIQELRGELQAARQENCELTKKVRGLH